ncbi:MAG: glycosyl hydrolase family 65 protein [Nostoc sp.]|uniref:glycosyl hydrolase family 65 protein n=1 Tax=Nostoc sp. TaxID=1180 RepID=UPI003031F5F7
MKSLFVSNLNWLRVNLNHQGNDLQIEITQKHLGITSAPENSKSVKIICKGQVATVQPGTSIIIHLH